MSAGSLSPTPQGAAQVPALRQFTFQRHLDNKEAIKDKMTWGVVVRAAGMSQWDLMGLDSQEASIPPWAKPQHPRLGH